MTRPLVLASLERRPPWTEHLNDSLSLSPDRLPEDLSPFDSAWIDATGLQPLRVARDVARVDPSLQAIVVAPPEDMSLHERALLFTPGVGEVWLIPPTEVGPETLARAREVTGTRRRYRESRGSLSRTLGQFNGVRPRRAIVSDAYLAALLHVLPDPVISVDESGRVVSWSDAAQRTFGLPDVSVLGRPLLDVLETTDPDALADALERAREETTRLELTVVGVGRSLSMDAVITSVATGGVDVRAMVFRDVTGERESLRQLKREVDLRSRSYAAMSHEIRTPINAIMGYNELLRMGAVEEGKRDEYLGRSQKAAAHLLELVNDVLDLSKLESGVLELQPEPVHVADLIQDLVDTLEPMASERETPLEAHCSSDPGEISTDAKRLKQILINLVTNALKFGEGRPVHVHCRRTEEAMTFEVQDQGRGIEPSQLDRIFEEFVQVGDTDEGTGLGLPISRKLAELLGGELSVSSEPGRGSTFSLRLPFELDDWPTGDSPTPTGAPPRTPG